MNRLIHEKSPVTSLCIYKDVSGIIQYNDYNKSIDSDALIDNVSKSKVFTNGDIKTEEYIMDVDGQPVLEHDEIEDYLYYDEEQNGYI